MRREDGQGLVELIVSLVILAVGIGSLLTLLTSSALSLQRSGQKGTALVLAERQIELYRSVGFRDIRLSDSAQSAAAALTSDPYVTANSSDSSIPSASNQITDADADTNPCGSPLPTECLPIQSVVGPDHRNYRVDTYIHAEYPQGGDIVASVTVIVRNADVASLPILARSASTFSSVNVANVNGKAITKMSFTAPKADITNGAISTSLISATLSNTASAQGDISFYVLPAPNSPSVPCATGSPWSFLGSASVAGDGTYHPSVTYSPPTAGTYYWYATYTGDSQNKKASSICGLSMAKMTVQAGKWSPTLSVSTTASTGVQNSAISGSTLTATLASSSGTTTSPITYMVYGPSATAPTSCSTSGAGWTQIGTITPDGDGSYNPTTGFTPTSIGTYWYWATYAADTTNNTASSTCGSTMAKTVVSVPPDTFGISTITSPKTAGTQFTIGTITAQLYSGGTDTSYSGSKVITFTGPGTSAKGNAPTYPASVTFTNGVATNVPITLFKAETTTLTATQGLITGSSGSFTVNGLAASAFTIDTVGTQVAGTAFGVTVRAVDAYGNAATYTGSHTLNWTTSPGNSPNGSTPTLNAGTATSVTFSNGSAIPTGLVLVNASSASSLTVKEGATMTGTSANFTVSAAGPTAIAFINCTKPTSANTTCSGSPFSTGNNGTLQANIAVKDNYGNTAVATSAMTIALSSASTTNYTVSPASVTINAGGSQSNQLTVTPATPNPALTKITATVTSGGGFAAQTVQVQK